MSRKNYATIRSFIKTLKEHPEWADFGIDKNQYPQLYKIAKSYVKKGILKKTRTNSNGVFFKLTNKKIKRRNK